MTEEEFRDRLNALILFRDRLNALILEAIESADARVVIKYLRHFADLMEKTLDRPED